MIQSPNAHNIQSRIVPKPGATILIQVFKEGMQGAQLLEPQALPLGVCTNRKLESEAKWDSKHRHSDTGQQHLTCWPKHLLPGHWLVISQWHIKAMSIFSLLNLSSYFFFTYLVYFSLYPVLWVIFLEFHFIASLYSVPNDCYDVRVRIIWKWIDEFSPFFFFSIKLSSKL